MKSSRMGHLDIVRYLCEHGAKVNFHGKVSKKVEYNFKKIVELTNDHVIFNTLLSSLG